MASSAVQPSVKMKDVTEDMIPNDIALAREASIVVSFNGSANPSQM